MNIIIKLAKFAALAAAPAAQIDLLVRGVDSLFATFLLSLF